MTSLAQRVTGTRPVIVIDLYCRISKDYDGTLRKVEDQEAQGREWIDDHAHLGYVLGEVFRDHALSAWNPKVKRPNWNKLMARLESGASQGVWVRDLDRFTRKPMEGERLIEVARKGLVVAAAYSSYDLTNYEDVERFRVRMAKAAAESDQISYRTSNGLHDKAMRGRNVASHRGFARDGYLPTPEEWEPGDPRVRVSEEQLAAERTAVRELVTGLLDGTTTLMDTARTWNAKGLLTTTGKRWEGASIRQLLMAPSIAGLNKTRGTYVVIKDVEPVVDRDTWDRLQLHFKSRKPGRRATKYILSGVLRCGHCGSPLYGRPVTKQTPYPDGEVRRQYWCQKRVKEDGGCGRLSIDQRWTDAAVEELVVARLEDPTNAERIAQHSHRVEEAAKVIKAELDTLNAEADELSEKTGTPGWSLERVNKAMTNYATRIAEAEAKLEALGEPDTVVDPNLVRDTWRTADVLGKRAMVKRAIPEGITIAPATSRGPKALDSTRLILG